MLLKSIKITNFKNYEAFEASFHAKLNIITGLNGTGKTNLLDAIYYLCFCKSYFQSSDAANVLHGETYFRLDGSFLSKLEADAENEEGDNDVNDDVNDIGCAYMRGKRKVVEKNKVAYGKFAEHIGFCPLVFIEPDDVQIIKGGGTNRRKLMDVTLAQYDKEYLQALIVYERNRKQRNALLKQFASQQTFDQTLINVYDEQLIESGSLIFEKRNQMLELLNPIFLEVYREISGDKEQVNFKYESQLLDKPFAELLKSSIQKDRIIQRTSIGIHNDDWLFEIKDHELKKLGSQGQQKSFLISLKLSTFHLLKSKMNKMPIILMDDIFDKLDNERIEQLIKIVSKDTFGQVFVTNTDERHLREILEKLGLEGKYFAVGN